MCKFINSILIIKLYKTFKCQNLSSSLSMLRSCKGYIHTHTYINKPVVNICGSAKFCILILSITYCDI